MDAKECFCTLNWNSAHSNSGFLCCDFLEYTWRTLTASLRAFHVFYRSSTKMDHYQRNPLDLWWESWHVVTGKLPITDTSIIWLYNIMDMQLPWFQQPQISYNSTSTTQTPRVLRLCSLHLMTVPPNTDVFLQRLCLWGKSRSYQDLLESKKKNVVATHFSEII